MLPRTARSECETMALFLVQLVLKIWACLIVLCSMLEDDIEDGYKFLSVEVARYCPAMSKLLSSIGKGSRNIFGHIVDCLEPRKIPSMKKCPRDIHKRSL